MFFEYAFTLMLGDSRIVNSTISASFTRRPGLLVWRVIYPAASEPVSPTSSSNREQFLADRLGGSLSC